jgi:two-component system response regulator ResD
MASQAEPAANRDEVRRRVLVVDDERTIAEVVCRYLQRAGYETRQAFTGPEAVSVAQAWQPELIVLDIMLPGFDGLEAMRRLDHEPNGAKVGCGPAVILLTARGEEPDRITGLKRGADDYVV